MYCRDKFSLYNTTMALYNIVYEPKKSKTNKNSFVYFSSLSLAIRQLSRCTGGLLRNDFRYDYQQNNATTNNGADSEVPIIVCRREYNLDYKVTLESGHCMSLYV